MMAKSFIEYTKRPKPRKHAPSDAQHQATMTNLSLANFERLRECLVKAGHYDFSNRVQALDDEFRAKLKGMKR